MTAQELKNKRWRNFVQGWPLSWGMPGRVAVIAAMIATIITSCATKGGWPCFAWQKNTDQKLEREGQQMLKTNTPSQKP